MSAVGNVLGESAIPIVIGVFLVAVYRSLPERFPRRLTPAYVTFVATILIVGFAQRTVVWLYLFIATASHGVLDALTNGGLGVAFFSPFGTTRYFFPFRPIEVSPIGTRFFFERGFSVLQSEAVWVWLPSIVFAIVAVVIRRSFRRSTGLTNQSS